MLLIHDGRSALRAAQQRHRAGKPLTRLQERAVTKAQAQHYNSAAVALANTLARDRLGGLALRAQLRRQPSAAGGLIGKTATSTTQHEP
jgi:hypothetical protein